MAWAGQAMTAAAASGYTTAQLPLTGLVASLLGKRDDSVPVRGMEIHGDPDGPPARLPSGIVVHRRSIGGRRVSTSEFLQAVRGIQLLPRADQLAIARAGVPVYLVPSTLLENTLLGATTIVQPTEGAPWRPTLVRVAVSAGRQGTEATGEIVQHELGHVLAVLNGQDRSEAAAERYAHSY